METVEILKSQRNRYPLLFVDRILNVQPGVSAIGKKNFTYNEWFFPAHYEDDPNVPGFILIEALVQTFIMTFLSLPEYKGNKTSFLDMDGVKFRKRVIPGDTLKINAELESLKRGIAKGSAEGFVEDRLAVCANFVVAIPSELEKFQPVSE